MSFTKKVVAIIGVSLISIGGIKLQKMSHLQQPIRSDTLISEGNRNFVLSGKDYQGRYMRNSNSNINCVESVDVEIMDSRNLNAVIIGSSVRAIEQSNCKLSATASNIDMKSDKNCDVEAEDAWCVFQANSNLKYKGKGGANEFLSKFTGNSNSHFTGNDNKIVASNNSNLKIMGNNNRLEIYETRNHHIQPAPIESNGNTFTVERSGPNSIRFVVQYVGAAVIKERKYQLGIIHFDIVAVGDRVNVTLDYPEDAAYSVMETTSNKIVIKVEKNGDIQTLQLKGDRIDAVGLNSINIFVDLV